MRRCAVILAVFAFAVLSAWDDRDAAQSAAGDAVGADLAIGPDVITAGRAWADGDEKGRKLLEEMARNGRADAQEVLAELLMSGSVIGARDPVTACGYFRQASTTRLDALHSLAVCAEQGIGGKPDLPRAAELYRQAADKGFAKSMCALGNLYIAGRGVGLDVARGFALCRKGAEAGDADAQTDVGNLYLKGVGVSRDIVQARSWYEKAASKGQPNAEFVLGQIYWNGDGVQADQDKAAELLRSAYGHGRLDAAELLGAWATARWMAAHPAGDVSLLDEAIKWDEAAINVAQDQAAKTRAREKLSLDRALKEAAAKQQQ